MDRFAKSVAKTSSILCIGLDPPLALAKSPRQIKSIINKTKPHAAAFKVNLAFYLARGAKGIDLLMRIRELTGDTPLILDGKFNDIGNTLEGYAAFAATTGATAVTASPYMGDDFSPFTRRGIGVFVLSTTTNQPALQSLQVTMDGEKLTRSLARHIALRVSHNTSQYGLVVGSDAGALRELCPDTWFLSPGLGAQEKSEKEILEGLRPDGLGLLVNASRSIWNAVDPAVEALHIKARLQPKAFQSPF